MKKLLRVDGIFESTERLFHFCDGQIGRIKKQVIALAVSGWRLRIPCKFS